MFGVVAWMAFGAAAYFVVQSEQHLTSRRDGVRTFDVVAREASGSLSSLRTAQQAYVAAGQGPLFWMSKVDSLLDSAAARVEELRRIATAADAQKSLSDAAAAINDLRGIDKRSRQYLQTDQALMAADVVFSEGGETAATAGRQIEAARQTEYLAWDAEEAALRRQQLYAAGGATGLAAIIIGLLMLVPAPRESADAAQPGTAPERAPEEPVEQRAAELLSLRTVRTEPLPVSSDLPRETVPILQATVELCTELNRVHDLDDLTRLLGRAAQIMDASGIVVWVGSPTGSSLRPVLAHGYSPQALSRMPHVPRSGDNAAAAAYRTGALQIVLTRPGISSGALAAPMCSPSGCIGALTAEIRNGSETSDGVQALAAIFAAQLGSVLVDSVVQAQQDDAPESRIASA